MHFSLNVFTLGVEIHGDIKPGYETVLTKDAVNFVVELHRKFNTTRLSLLDERKKRQKLIDEGAPLTVSFKTTFDLNYQFTMTSRPRITSFHDNCFYKYGVFVHKLFHDGAPYHIETSQGRVPT